MCDTNIIKFKKIDRPKGLQLNWLKISAAHFIIRKNGRIGTHEKKN